MNIYFVATREVMVVKTGNVSNQTLWFGDAWTTGPSVARDILNSKDPFQAYRDWVMSLSAEYTSESDFTARESHRINFDEWLNMCEREGYDIEVYVW